MNAVSLFAGCGGSDLGLRSAGIKVSWANEKSESACAAYEEVAAPDTIEHADIQTVDRFPDADILAGCYPCQGYSQGGARRSSRPINLLYREFDRALRQIKPLAFIVENVDGMGFKQNRRLLNNQLIRFRLAGYSVEWKVLNAADFGLAQIRKRLFIVGIRTSECKTFKFPNPTHGSETRQPWVTQKEVIGAMPVPANEAVCNEPLHWYYLSRNRRKAWCEPAACVVAHWRHVGLHPDSPPLYKVKADHWEFRDDGIARRLSYLECAALQGFPNPAAFRSSSVKLRYRAIGNAVPPPLFGAIAKQLVEILK